MLRIAFKEWAAICRGVAAGRQSLILRKGGIAESGGRFRPEHARFWLYPTHFHEQRAGLKSEAGEFLDDERPAPGWLRLSHLVDVTDVAFVQSLDAALALDGEHLWSADTVRQRFHYRTPGLYVLTVRAFAVRPQLVPDRPEYAGCKTWVELAEGGTDDSTAPVLSDNEYVAAAARIRAVTAGR